jgi:hypothetical protein
MDAAFGNRDFSIRVIRCLDAYFKFALALVAVPSSSSWFCASAQCPPVSVKSARCAITKDFDLFEPAPGSSPALANPLSKDTNGQLKMVVLGDSVMWGNGLKVDEKFVTLFGKEMANLTGREVHVISFAHSGARMHKIDDMNSVLHEIEDQPQGDLDSQRPTTEEQEECAKAKVPDAEILLLDGCINEVGATNIALPFPLNFTDKKQIAKDAKACGPHMQKLLQKATTQFPNATIAVMNYYRVVSTQSKPLFEARPGVANNLHPGTSSEGAAELSQEQQKLLGESGKKGKIRMRSQLGVANSESEAAFFQPWSYNSDAFLATSQDCFAKGVAETDGTPGPKCEKQFPLPYHTFPAPVPTAATKTSRVFLVTVPDKPEYAYGAEDVHIWRLPSDAHPDNTYVTRKALCSQVFAPDLLAEYKCSINAIAHPNVEGAQTYRDSLVSVFKVAWGRQP